MAKVKKVCLIGRFAVGKTSLVKQYIDNQFGDKYKTTVGVSISKKEIILNGEDVSLVIWDIAGFEKDGHYTYYLRGVHGLIWVVDGTEPESIEILKKINETLPDINDVPSVCFINKHDLVDEWIISGEMIEKLEKSHDKVLLTSAKTGENVESGFNHLTQLMFE